jgi:hypothetical protein
MKMQLQVKGREDWKILHNAAVVMPSPVERPIVTMLEGWLEYSQQWTAQYGDESKLSDDQILGWAWGEIAVALRSLLNGDCGRLDCGTLDSIIYAALEKQGFDPDLL